MEGDGRADRLFLRHRAGDAGADLVRHHRTGQRSHPGGGDPAYPALHRHVDRLAGVPGIAAPACAGHRPGTAAADRRLGQGADRQRPRCRRHQRPNSRHRQAGAGRRALRRARGARRGRDAGRDRARRGDSVHHRPRAAQGGRLRRGRRGAELLGFIHGEGIGIGRSPPVALAYLGVAAILLYGARSVVPLREPVAALQVAE